MKMLLTAVAFAASLATSASAATLVNGSLTGSLANGGVPTGWSVGTPSPDTNRVDAAAGSTAFDYFVNPNNSPDGGTWVGIARDGTGFVEYFFQTISDFVVGQSYTLSWWAGNFGFEGGYYTNSNAVEVVLDGAGIGTGSTLGLDPDWYQQSLTFTATSTSHDLGFRLAMNPASYVQVDGVALEVAAIPIPGTGLLLVAGIWGLAATRRRRRA